MKSPGRNSGPGFSSAGYLKESQLLAYTKLNEKPGKVWEKERWGEGFYDWKKNFEKKPVPLAHYRRGSPLPGRNHPFRSLAARTAAFPFPCRRKGERHCSY